MTITEERFFVDYIVSGAEDEALKKANDICLEQTVEFPEELLPDGFIRDHLVGRVESFEPDGAERFHVRISYADETATNELTQLLNVIFGNISIKPGIYIDRFALSERLLQQYKGPRFGRAGLRRLLDIYNRPILSSALKPMGLSADKLAGLAYQLALGGIDIVKDDHGITDQCFARFEERVVLCAAAVRKANRITGGRSIYVANVTAGYGEIADRARIAKDAGAGGLLIAPALTGFDAMRRLADDDGIALPVFSHPAFLGSYVLGPQNGFSHQALFGQVMRLAGADAVIYPNFGGRFSFSQKECEALVQGTAAVMGHIKTIFPMPGGGMSVERVPELRSVYGNDAIFLIGGGLFTQGPDVIENCRNFRRLACGSAF